ncbi:competence protein ComJ [Methylomonas sp. HW2-6]|uniref:competence protein ComJ n=1 Tax=Methylomonas sp. HW2-6 TaxID=3376687 RepID=UPI004041B719
MAKLVIKSYLSYAQVCIFSSLLDQPFNDWSERNVSQGFSWRPGSSSFRTLVEDGDHQINVFIDEPIPPRLQANCIRAFKVPFETVDGNIEISGISESTPLEISPGQYVLQVEFLQYENNCVPEINIRFNKGDTDFSILKADEEIDSGSDLDLMAIPAT